MLYFDEAGFSLEPVVPYAWQPIGQTIEIPSSRSNRLNVLGFLGLNGDITSYVFEDSISSEEVVACFDRMAEQVTKKTWVVIDNASMHRSHLFNSHLELWEKKGLYIKRLPAYSPELNLIEILWRKIKYEWLPFAAYDNFATLKESLDNVLKKIGMEYLITFA